jgi:hypothetical protein
MAVAQLGKSRWLHFLVRPGGAAMGSRLRRWLLPPEKTLRGANLKAG